MKFFPNAALPRPRRLSLALAALGLGTLTACGGGEASSGTGAAVAQAAGLPAPSVAETAAAPSTSDTPDAAGDTMVLSAAASAASPDVAAAASTGVGTPPAAVAAATATVVAPADTTVTPSPVATASTTTTVGSKRSFVHPGIGWSLDDWDYYKANVSREPWKSAYASLSKDSHAKLDYTTHLVEVLDTDPKFSGYESDMTAVHYMTVVGHVSGNPAYLQKATQIAGDWCAGHKSGMPFLNISSYITRFLGAADFLRATYSGWTAEQTKLCQRYVTNLYWPALHIGDGFSGAGSLLKSANQGTALLHTAMDVAVFTDSAAKFDMVVNAFLTNTNGGILNSLPTGQVGDSGRDQGHALGQIFGLASVAETAWKQGVDLYAANDNRLLKAHEYWAQYNVSDGKNPPAFTEFGPSYGLYLDHGCCAMTPYREPATLVHKAYVIRKGLSAPWTEQLLARYGQTAMSSTFYRTADPSTATAATASWTEPVAKALTQAGDLKTLDVGRVGAAGSTQFDNGTWTLKTKSQKIESGYRYAYREMKTDSTFIARIVDVSGAGGAADGIDAAGGIQIRTQLDAGTKAYLSLTTTEKGTQMTGFWRQTTASLSKDYQTYDVTSDTPHFFPYWLKIVRKGNFINAYTAPDGKSWSNISHARFDVEMPETVYVGLTAFSGSNTVEGTVVFDNVSFGAADTNSLVGAPASLSATAQTGGVRLDWSAKDGAVFYKVQRSLSADGPATLLATEIDATGFVDSTALPNTTYYYQVASASHGGLSPYSAKVSIRTSP